MLFCDSFDKLRVCLTPVTGSHECPGYHDVHYCAQMAHFSVKSEILLFCRVRQVLSHNLGQVLSLTSFVIPCLIVYKQPLQMITKNTGD